MYSILTHVRYETSDKMAATNETRVDTTMVGLLLVGFVLLLFGIFWLQGAGVFGTGAHNKALDSSVLAQIYFVVGLILILLTIFAYRTGKTKATIVFPFVAMFLFVFYYDITMNSEMGVVAHSSNWALYIVLAIFLFIIAIYMFIEKAPKFLSVLLLLIGLTLLFYGIACIYGSNGPCYDPDVRKALDAVMAIFSFLAFIVATYLGLAYGDPKKIPLI